MSCENNSALNPITACNNSEGLIKKVFLAKKGFKFATVEAAAIEANWITAIQAKDIIPLPSINGFESMNEGTVYDETAYGSSFIRDGRMSFKTLIDSNSDLHKRLRSIRSSGGYGIFITYMSGLVKGYQPEGTVEVHPFSIQMINAELHNESTDSTTGKTPIVFSFTDPVQHDDSPVVFNPAFSPVDLNALYSSDITIVTAVATSIVFDVNINHINKSVKTANPVEGLVAADFSLLTAAGVAQTIGGVTESATQDGRYTLTGTGLVTGSLNFKKPELMTTKGYESTGAVTVTIA